MNTVDELMKRYQEALATDPTEQTPDDITAIVAYHRAAREGLLSAPKSERTKSEEPKKKLDLAALGLKIKPAAPPTAGITRRL